MLAISSSEIPTEAALANDLECSMVDAVSHQTEGASAGCPLTVEYAIVIQPADDMLIPLFLCKLHYNAFRLGVREGVGLDPDLLKKI
jgi:hypothetical protein